MSRQILLTDEGLKKLEEELEMLKTVRRKEVSENIRIARSFGDLSENSEYDEAKNEQAFVEARIIQIESMLKNVKVVDESELTDAAVSIGSKVLLFDKEFSEQITYQIVGITESEPSSGKISDESPIGKVLLGKQVGDMVTVEVPDGVLSFEILQITR